MKLLSIPQIVELTELARLTVQKRLGDMTFTLGKGKGSPKLFRASEALRRCIMGDISTGEPGEVITAAEAARQLTVARKQQIDLEMEVTRKDRWPKAIVLSIFGEGLDNVIGVIKAHEGKTMTATLIQDLLTEIRAVPIAMEKSCK